jgi:chromosome segregation ATPase
LDADYQKDKAFYEEALEARMTQMEELEQTNDTLTARLESSRQREIDLQAQIEQLDFDLDLLKRKSGNAPRGGMDNDLLRDL